MAKQVVAEENFLLPNWTFVAELVAFVLILVILGRYVYPFISKAMHERQEMIKKQVEDAEEAKTSSPRPRRRTRTPSTRRAPRRRRSARTRAPRRSAPSRSCGAGDRGAAADRAAR